MVVPSFWFLVSGFSPILMPFVFSPSLFSLLCLPRLLRFRPRGSFSGLCRPRAIPPSLHHPTQSHWRKNPSNHRQIIWWIIIPRRGHVGGTPRNMARARSNHTPLANQVIGRGRVLTSSTCWVHLVPPRKPSFFFFVGFVTFMTFVSFLEIC